LNATVAGLCVDLYDKNEDKRAALRKCLGIALIRAVDVPGDKLYVLTPLDDDTLERVNVLEIGRLELPTDLLQTSQYQSPYLTLHSLSAIASGSAPQRARNNLIRAGQVK
jgi:polynucleotide 5'-hydroxyl-kinase GRC3/NOL9